MKEYIIIARGPDFPETEVNQAAEVGWQVHSFAFSDFSYNLTCTVLMVRDRAS